MSRALLCNQINDAGDEIWTGGAGGTTSGNTCQAYPSTVSSVPSSTKSISSGSYSVTVTLMANADIIATVTDAYGCSYSCTTSIIADDVRCFAGNSGISKVTICHKTGSTKNPCVKICVDDDAVQTHLNHGDKLGTCPTNCIWKEDETSEIDHGILHVYPNPNNGLFTIDFAGEYAPIQIFVTNLLGQVVYTESLDQFDGAVQREIDLNKLASGSYYVNIQQGDHRYTRQIAVTH